MADQSPEQITSAVVPDVGWKHQLRDTAMRILSNASWIVGGVILFGSYILILFIVVMSLTAYQVQTRIHALNLQDKNLNIWSITSKAAEIFDSEKQQIHQDKLKSLRGRLINKASEIKFAQTKVNGIKTELIGVLKSLDTAINVADGIKIDALLSESARGLSDQKGGEKVDELRNTLFGLMARLEKHNNDFTIVEAEIKDRQGEKVSERTKNLLGELSYFYYSKAGRVRTVLSAMFGDTQTNYLFITMPSEALILMVVIAMGALGSLISVTLAFFDDTRKEKANFFLFRPLLGAIVAIGVYVITKAGVTVASSIPAQADGVVRLNAFFISFVSLVAGLMSEAAIESIKSAGNGFFRGNVNDSKPRYAIAASITTAMKKLNKKKAKLYQRIDQPNSVVDEWLNETKLVPHDAQIIIASWLKQPVRNLFTELKPVTKNVAQKPNKPAPVVEIGP